MSTRRDRPRPRITVFGVFALVGNLLTISIAALVFCLGLVTAAPGCAAAVEARRRVSLDGPPVSLIDLLASTRRRLPDLWMFGPIAAGLAVMTWTALAFWLAIPPPFGVIMLAVTVLLGGVGLLVALALPVAASTESAARRCVVAAAGLVVARPWVSMVGLGAAVAAIVIAMWFPAVGTVALVGVLIEIAHRAFPRPRGAPKGVPE